MDSSLSAGLRAFCLHLVAVPELNVSSPPAGDAEGLECLANGVLRA